MNPHPLLSVSSAVVGTMMMISPCVAQIADSPDDSVSGIPVNYTETNVGAYTLPDPLLLANGQMVTEPRMWMEQRRPEIVKLFEENEYGRAPGAPADMAFDVFDKGTPAFDGRATRTQVTVYFSKDRSANYLDLLIYLPAHVEGPVPVLLQLGWTANNLAVNDPGVKEGRLWDRQTKERRPAVPGSRGFGRMKIDPMLGAGFGVATFNYSDIDPDALDSISLGVRSLYLKEGEAQPGPDEWGSIAAWAWGVSRVMDYFETDPQIDADRVAIMGASRLGKTVLWAGASDPRIAMVIASCSGEGGAALSRRHYGETVAHLVEPTRFPYQFCANYATWADRVDEMPVDAHMLVALIAPRPLLLQTGNTDKWSDPYGEFLAAHAATPVYELFGKKGMETANMPEPGTPVLNTLGYYMHNGGHGVQSDDWEVYTRFMETHLKP